MQVYSKIKYLYYSLLSSVLVLSTVLSTVLVLYSYGVRVAFSHAQLGSVRCDWFYELLSAHRATAKPRILVRVRVLYSYCICMYRYEYARYTLYSPVLIGYCLYCTLYYYYGVLVLVRVVLVHTVIVSTLPYCSTEAHRKNYLYCKKI